MTEAIASLVNPKPRQRPDFCGGPALPAPKTSRLGLESRPALVREESRSEVPRSHRFFNPRKQAWQLSNIAGHEDLRRLTKEGTECGAARLRSLEQNRCRRLLDQRVDLLGKGMPGHCQIAAALPTTEGLSLTGPSPLELIA